MKYVENLGYLVKVNEKKLLKNINNNSDPIEVEALKRLSTIVISKRRLNFILGNQTNMLEDMGTLDRETQYKEFKFSIPDKSAYTKTYYDKIGGTPLSKTEVLLSPNLEEHDFEVVGGKKDKAEIISIIGHEILGHGYKHITNNNMLNADPNPNDPNHDGTRFENWIRKKKDKPERTGDDH